jgi:hypothetical protein
VAQACLSVHSARCAIARPQMPHIEDMIFNLGALQSVTFKSVGPGGADIYDLKFEHGSPCRARLWKPWIGQP